MDDLISEFSVESLELCDAAESALLALESGPNPRDSIDETFRALHTIKGSAGFMGFPLLEKTAHAGEAVLSDVREEKLNLTPELVSLLLKALDDMRQRIEHLRDGQGDAPLDDALIAQLESALEGTNDDTSLKDMSDDEITRILHDTDSEPSPDLKDHDRIMAPEPSRDPVRDDMSTAPGKSVETVRVAVPLLDTLMNLVGELVLSRNRILQWTSVVDDTNFFTSCQVLDAVTSEIQEKIMQTRLQRVDLLFSKLPRMVRDVAMKCGKEIDLEVTGGDTELDRTLLEAVKEPLSHMIRNSADHGIESPEAREAAGKPRTGCVSVGARHESGQVVITIADDGAGIVPDRVARAAVDKGVIPDSDLNLLTDQQKIELIFSPGFSTAAEVTNISGRGVGMDVVRTKIESIGGSVSVESRVGKGTSFHFAIPLTMSIVPALLVRAAEHRFAIPQSSLVELLLCDADNQNIVQAVRGVPTVTSRGSLLPLVDLRSFLGLEAHPLEGELHIAIVDSEGSSFGILIDEVEDTQEIVVKPLQKELKHLTFYSGATILGDGSTALILDVSGIAGEIDLEARMMQAAEDDREPTQMGSFLVFENIDGGRLAMGLDIISRFEEVKRSQVEKMGGRYAIQYRGSILPLMSLNHFLEERRGVPRVGATLNPDEDVPVVICDTGNGGSIGVIVKKVLDTREVDTLGFGASTRQGILGTTVLLEKITEVVDTRHFLEAVTRELSPENR